jgi:hypothetical protein
MCLIIHAHGHITVKVLLEQLWPMFDQNKSLTFLHRYDFIIRSHSEKPLDRLYILSAQWAPKGKTLSLEQPSSRMIRLTDWIITEEPGATGATERTVRVDANSIFQVRQLVPKLSLPGC